MLQISEWLPNPKGVDSKGEWVELQNGNTTSINTAGWVLKNEKGVGFVLSGRTLSPGNFLVIKKPELSLSLRNSNGGLGLFDSSGTLVDQIKFLGTAPEGKSFGRTSLGNSWMTPTPGTPNQTASSSLTASVLPLEKPIHDPSFPIISFVFFPIFITAFLLYTVKQDEVLSKLLLEGNRPDREDEGLAYTLKKEE